MKKELYIHIGTHKTGSTSIQVELFRERERLRDLGYHYFSTLPNRKESPLTHDWFDFRNVSSRKTKLIRKKELLKYLANVQENKIIFSNEMFSWIFDNDELLEIKQLFANFNVKIIVYLRRQDKQIISHCQQASKSLYSTATNYYRDSINGWRAIPIKKYDEYLNYNNKIQQWAMVFGKENIIVRVFDSCENVVKDFYNVLNLDYDGNHRTNESVGFISFKVGHILNKYIPHGFLNKKIRQKLKKSNFDKVKALPSRADAERFYDFFRQDNESISNEFLTNSNNKELFNDDFTMYPLESGDVWNENSADEAVDLILSTIAPYSKLTPELLIDSANKLMNIDHKLADKLLAIANELNVNN